MSKKLELLPPADASVLQYFEDRLKMLQNLLKYKRTMLEKAPAGGLRLIQNHGRPQYYLRSGKNMPQDATAAVYIPKSNQVLARRLAQKDYDKKLAALLEKQIAWLEQLLKTKPPSLDSVYEKYNAFRRQLISPATLTDKDFAALWQAVEYAQKPFAAGAPEHLTRRGEKVRSKSEVLIANELSSAGIPYRYEFPLKLSTDGLSNSYDTVTFHPDFCCLKLSNRREILWEHLGLCDSPDYAATALSRLAVYQHNGFFPGRSLILTFETKAAPLTARVIRSVIQEYF